MSAAIQVKLSPEAQAIVSKWKRMPEDFPQAVAKGMTRGLELTTGRIIENRLSGKGPFPVEQHRLGQVTQRLVRSTRATPAKVETIGEKAKITGAIGADVFYARIHEFGGKRAPERAPFRTGIRENVPLIQEEIEREIEKLQ